jgi:tRNA(His) guanylyltransferase
MAFNNTIKLNIENFVESMDNIIITPCTKVKVNQEKTEIWNIVDAPENTIYVSVEARWFDSPKEVTKYLSKGKHAVFNIYKDNDVDKFCVLDYMLETTPKKKEKKMSKNDSLGDRMKTFESVNNIKLIRRMPLIIRLDGKAFHTFTKKFDKPFDKQLSDVMAEVSKYLVKNVQGCKMAYTQSDEISLLITDYDELNTDSWFDKKVQKMVSVSAAMATMKFQQLIAAGAIDEEKMVTKDALFDSRAFVIPKEDVTNYFIWRQQDAIRNSVQMLAQSLFSHKQLQKKSCKVLKEMLIEEKNTSWEDVETRYKHGICVLRQPYGVEIDTEIPVFTEDRSYVDSRFIFEREK